jgi:uncharacterized membrane protein
VVVGRTARSLYLLLWDPGLPADKRLMLAFALALGASAAWGGADFIAGVGARRVALTTVLLVSQAAGLAVLAVCLAAGSQPAPGASSLALAALAGLFNALALAALYRGLSHGKMGLVAPIAATDAVVPVVFGLMTGDRPAALAVIGIAVALAGIVLVSRSAAPDGERAGIVQDSPARSVALGLLAAVCFGAFMVALGRATMPSALWAVSVSRCTTLAVLLGAALVLRPGRAAGRRQWLALLTVGVLDAGAGGLFAFATTKGLLSLVGALSSFYPVVTLVLARVFLHERLGRLQQAGAVAAVLGAALIGSAL